MTSSTSERVTAHTADEINRRIRREMEIRLSYLRDHPEMIDGRLDELDREWDIERVLEANAATLAFTGVALGAVSDRKWLILPALVTAFLLQHAVEGWCPPLPVLRRMGFRTAEEIAEERYALKALRGDFDLLHQAEDKLSAILRAVGLRKAGTPPAAA